MKRARTCLVAATSAAVLLVCAGMFPAITMADQHAVPEHHLKAVLLYNFVKFVTWPKEAMGARTDPIVIGVLDLAAFDDAFGVVVGRKAQRRQVVVRECTTLAEASRCHVLFLNTVDDLLVKRMLQDLHNRPVLTVGEQTGFTRWGGVIRLYREEDRLRFEIRRSAAQRTGLRLSAQLLQVATAFEEPGEDAP